MELANRTTLAPYLELCKVTGTVELLLEIAEILTVEQRLDDKVDNVAETAQALFSNIDVVMLAERLNHGIVI